LYLCFSQIIDTLRQQQPAIASMWWLLAPSAGSRQIEATRRAFGSSKVPGCGRYGKSVLLTRYRHSNPAAAAAAAAAGTAAGRSRCSRRLRISNGSDDEYSKQQQQQQQLVDPQGITWDGEETTDSIGSWQDLRGYSSSEDELVSRRQRAMHTCGEDLLTLLQLQRQQGAAAGSNAAAAAAAAAGWKAWRRRFSRVQLLCEEVLECISDSDAESAATSANSLQRRCSESSYQAVGSEIEVSELMGSEWDTDSDSDSEEGLRAGTGAAEGSKRTAAAAAGAGRDAAAKRSGSGSDADLDDESSSDETDSELGDDSDIGQLAQIRSTATAAAAARGPYISLKQESQHIFSVLKTYLKARYFGVDGKPNSGSRRLTLTPVHARRRALLQRQLQEGSRVRKLRQRLIDEQNQFREGQRQLRRLQKQQQQQQQQGASYLADLAAEAAATAAEAAAAKASADGSAAKAAAVEAAAYADAAAAAAAAGPGMQLLEMHVGGLGSSSSSNAAGVQVQWDDPQQLLQHLSVRVHFTGSEEDALSKQQRHMQTMQQLLQFQQHCQAAAAAHAAAPAAAQQQQQQQQHRQQGASTMQCLADAAAAAAAAASPASTTAAVDDASYLSLLSSWLLFDHTDIGLADQLLTLDPAQQQHYNTLLQSWELWQVAAWQQMDSITSFRGLLWSLLQQLKPSVQQWYQQMATSSSAAAPNQQQQHGGSSSSSSVDMVNDAPPDLWEAVGGSIASDLIVIPPAFRDLLGSGWAGGAGRLPPAVASSGSQVAVAAAAAAAADAAGSAEEQQQSAAAARMLVVQYARSLRRIQDEVVSAGFETLT
jgi:hypothetical protein